MLESFWKLFFGSCCQLLLESKGTKKRCCQVVSLFGPLGPKKGCHGEGQELVEGMEGEGGYMT